MTLQKKFKKGEVESADEYFHKLDKTNNIKMLVDAGQHRDKFDNCADFLDDLMASQ